VYRLHQHPGSGNCYKIQLLLQLLGLPYVTANILAGESAASPAMCRWSTGGSMSGTQDLSPEFSAALARAGQFAAAPGPG